MNLIKPKVEIIEQKDILKHIELCGRVCYKSEYRITEDSSQKFVDGLLKNGHLSVLEHGTIYLKRVLDTFESESFVSKYTLNKYSKVNIPKVELHGVHGQTCPDDYIYITTNYRVLVENDWLEDLKYQCEPTKYHTKRISVKFLCNRGISHELVRHRVFSFSQESTRFCNYSKDKFNNNITYIIPSWLNIEEGIYKYNEELDIVGEINTYTGENNLDIWNYLNSLLEIEETYMCLTNTTTEYANPFTTWTAQQARDILPNALKTEIIMTGFNTDWQVFLNQRTTSACHPQMLELTLPLKELLCPMK